MTAQEGCCLIFIALFLPPLAVLLRRGCSLDLLINLLLTFHGWLPGVLHAWYIVLRYNSRRKREVVVREKPVRYDDDYYDTRRHSRRGYGPDRHYRPRRASYRSQEVGYS